MVVAVLFLLFLPFVPVLHAVPSLVTAPALVIVGVSPHSLTSSALSLCLPSYHPLT